MSDLNLMPKKEVIELISKATGLSERHIAERVLKRSDAPKPKAIIGTKKAYYKPDIYKFLGVK